MLVNEPHDFDYLEIGLAAPDRVRFWSYGEVEKPETINYRTFKPERKGLFCEKIFGPVKDWECSCGKYRRVRYRGIVCERCGVEVTHSKVRRERMGHIELAADVTHIWFLKGIPSYLSIVMDMPSREVEEVVYYDSYIITKVEESLREKYSVGQIISSMDYLSLKSEHDGKIEAGSGARAIKEILKGYDLKKLSVYLRDELAVSKGQKKLKIAKRSRIIEGLLSSGNRPEWMILEAIPIMPPDLRPMVQLEGGRFATSDLNDLYRRVVNRNNRLRRLMDIGAPEMIIRNEKRMLQESVDVLISNGKRGRSVTGSNGRPLKSLGNIIEGKQGRFRQNLLGKRVDYSGRSVIVVGPHLKFHQCGLPKDMALELFKPFVICKLVSEGHVSNVKSAKRKIEQRDVVVWDVLEKVIKGQAVLLNRAPTLHRLGIQAFEPKLVDGSAIQIHPLVCTAFNADFDGDQMAVHIPLSIEAQTESWLLIMSTNNILSPSSGKSIVTPTQDMILGCYYLTALNEKCEIGKGKYFGTIDEAMIAWESGVIGTQTIIKVRVNAKWEETSVGRLTFNEAYWKILKEHGISDRVFVNEIIGKKRLGGLVFQWFHKYGSYITSLLADEMKRIGFKYSTLSGISISVDDLQIPEKKKEILIGAETEMKRIEKLFERGKISEAEKLFRSNDIWRKATQEVSDALEGTLGKLNNLYIMANSGARGNIDQVRQLAGMRGLMSDAQGRTVSIPIKANFKEGLSITEYFISSYGARKGLVDTALRTADSGYLTRRLVDVAQDVIVSEADCGEENGIMATAVNDGISEIVPLSESLEGRYLLEDIVDPITGEVIATSGDLLTGKQANAIEATEIKAVRIRSIYSCKSGRGLCQKCYGTDLCTGNIINMGEAVGIIAAQSIGEPGTQLTMRTFHTGGVDLTKASRVTVASKWDGIVEFPKETKIRRLKSGKATSWILVEDSDVNIRESAGNIKRVTMQMGSTLKVKDGDSINSGEALGDFDPVISYLFSKSEGVVKFLGFDAEKLDGEDYVTNVVSQDGDIFISASGEFKEFVVGKKFLGELEVGTRVRAGTDISSSDIVTFGGLVADISVVDKKKESKAKDDKYLIKVQSGEFYPVHKGDELFVSASEKVSEYDILVQRRLESIEQSGAKDIVSGLPRVEELFEARRPKDCAVLAQIDGVVELLEDSGTQIIRLISEEKEKREYKLPTGTRIKVFAGQKVKKGDLLTFGILSPHDILETRGVDKAQMYLGDEVQKVYRSQGVSINGKHIEVIVRQMTRKLVVSEIGNSKFLPNELVDMRNFNAENKRLVEEESEVCTAARVLLGITRVSLNTDSFVSASSFQQTASVLTKAAIQGQRDPMYGLKENVIIGKLIPAGTGFSFYNNISLDVRESKTRGLEKRTLGELQEVVS